MKLSYHFGENNNVLTVSLQATRIEPLHWTLIAILCNRCIPYDLEQTENKHFKNFFAVTFTLHDICFIN